MTETPEHKMFGIKAFVCPCGEGFERVKTANVHMRSCPVAAQFRKGAHPSQLGKPTMPPDAKTWAATVRSPLGTLGDLQIPYGHPHGSIVAYCEERLRELHWPRTLHTLRGALLRNDMNEAHERLKGPT